MKRYFVYFFVSVCLLLHFQQPKQVSACLQPNPAPSINIHDYTMESIAIVEGRAISPASGLKKVVDFEFIVGTADIRVDRWLKGSGPAEIKVGDFRRLGSCDSPLLPNDSVILFLGKKTGTNEYSLLNGYQDVPSDKASEIIAVVGNPPLVVDHGVLDRLTTIPVMAGFLLFLFGLVLVLSVLLVRRLNRK